MLILVRHIAIKILGGDRWLRTGIVLEVELVEAMEDVFVGL
jgi:hypothetical protein